MIDAKFEAETWKNEDLEKIQYLLKDFQVRSYEMNLFPHEEIVYDEHLRFLSKPELNFNFPEGKIFIDYSVRVIRDENPDRILAKITTRTFFEVEGLPYVPINENYTQVKFPQTLLLPIVSIAISSTRGAWSLLTGGKFILPAIDLSQMKITGVTEGAEIKPSPSSFSIATSPPSSQFEPAPLSSEP
jgi:hypothetical protein